jgi:ankyrin repeat protein
MTPLVAAIIVKEFDLVRLLVEGGAEIDAPEPRQGDTPLHSALIQGRDDIAQYLLDRGANPDLRNKLGISPRQIQAFNRLRAVVHR